MNDCIVNAVRSAFLFVVFLLAACSDGNAITSSVNTPPPQNSSLVGRGGLVRPARASGTRPRYCPMAVY